MESTRKDPTEVKIKDLPIYSEPPPVTIYNFVESQPLPLQNEFAGLRYAIRDTYSVFADRFKTVDRVLKSGKNTILATDDYIRNEGTVLAKAGAITIGGMTGFVLGLRRYGIRKFVYATVGLLTMTAFCYPQETIEFSKIGVAHAQRTWEDFQKSPEPAKKK